MPTSLTSPLRQLANLISTSVDEIETRFEQSQLKYPGLDMPFNPTSPAEAASMAPEVVQAASLIVAACGQLSATVKVPALTLYDAVGGFHIASCIRVAVESNTVEILREAGPQGLHVRGIAAKNRLDPTKISRILRLLATHHIFREISPDVFTNNRLSSMMDTLKPVDEILANPERIHPSLGAILALPLYFLICRSRTKSRRNLTLFATRPEEKHVGTPGMTALMEHSADEVFKGSAFMTEALLDSVTGHSEAPEHAPMALAFKSSKSSWEWYEEPGNEWRSKRYNAAMEGSSKADPPDAIMQGFNWSELAPNSVIVDVGGGIGSTTIKLAKKYPGLRYVVQDRPTVIEQAKGYWGREFPEALESGLVKVQGHDFFETQPVTNASVFLLRMIIHDYGHDKATIILKNLRNVATPQTKLLLVEQVVPYACPDEASRAVGEDIIGGEQLEPPKPLLANLGKANAIAYIGDFQMYVGLNGEERTLGSFLELADVSGWKIKQIFPIPGSMHKQVLAVPA